MRLMTFQIGPNSALQPQYMRVITQNYMSFNDEYQQPEAIGNIPEPAKLDIESCGELPVYVRNEGIVPLEFPYYSRTHILCNEISTSVTPLNGSYEATANSQAPMNCAYIRYETPNSTGDLKGDWYGYRAGRDDFDLSFYGGIPPFWYVTQSIFN